MSVAVPGRVAPRPGYGWSADGKSAAEISSDIAQTRYRLDADLRALTAALAPERLVPLAVLTAGLAALALLVRIIRRRRR
jgi:hypothetical protein